MLVLSFVSSFVKDIIIHLLKYGEAHLSKGRTLTSSSSEEESRPSPLLVTLPVSFIAGSIKDMLPVVELGNSTRFIVNKISTAGLEESESGVVCIVCLGLIKGSDQVRELCNCSHIFHRECVDAWIDEGQKTCPVCRSKLLPAAAGYNIINNNYDQEEADGTDVICISSSNIDPWRRERMIYLFGDDLDLATSSIE